ncbi:MAG: nucleoside triphosphate pyrophosphohydrolase [Thiohalobacteraceae bacterium]
MSDTDQNAAHALERLLKIMRRLRNPDGGCPWDLAQDFRSIAPFTLEEAYEVADAIERGRPDELRDELGDLLFQVVFHARMGEERGWFDFAAVATAIGDKLERRHPHVFGDAEVADVEAQSLAWEAHKHAERVEQGRSGLMDGVPLALPALVRAAKLQRRAAKIGLDWPDAEGPMAKIGEELAELRAARDTGTPEAQAAEVGDLLFSCVNLARHLGVDAEAALRGANSRFAARANRVAASIEETAQPADSAALDKLWEAAKRNGL